MAQVLIEVDDLNFGIKPEYLETLKAALEERFIFGKMEFQEADFAGRHIKVEKDKVIMHQEKYILEKIFPHKLPRGKLRDRTALLDPEDFEAHRSLLYKVNWVAHQTRPEAAGIVSLLASRLHHATVHDLSCLNKIAVHLRSTARQALILHQFDSEKMVFVAASDAGGIDGKPILNSNEGRHGSRSLGHPGHRLSSISITRQESFYPVVEVIKDQEACCLHPSWRSSCIFSSAWRIRVATSHV